MKKEYVELYDKFIETRGIDSQIRMCIEEMSELTKELCKYYRSKGTDKEMETIAHIKEELADVTNTIEQMTHYFGEEDIAKIREYKMGRARDELKKDHK